MHSLWSCGCIDCFCSASFDFQDIWPSDGYPLGNLEKLRNKHGCGPPNFGPYHPTPGGGEAVGHRGLHIFEGMGAPEFPNITTPFERRCALVAY